MNIKLTADARGWISENDGNSNLSSMTINGPITYLGGSIANSIVKTVSFTASLGETTAYEISGSGVTCSLNSSDPVDVRYEFWDKTGQSNPNFFLIPNGGKTINGQSSANITTQYFGRVVRKDSSGNWIMAL